MAILLLIASVAVGQLAARSATSLLARSALPALHTRFIRHVVVWSFVALGVMISLSVLGLTGLATGILTGGGITAVVFGFAFREIGENLLAGLFLAFSRPFEVGDLIESDGQKGKVKGIELRNTHVRTEDGRDVYIPSSQLFKNTVVNYTVDGLRRLSFTVGIDHSNDPRQACQLLAKTTKDVNGVLTDPAPGALINGFLPQHTELMVYFWVNTFNHEPGLGDIRMDVLANCREALLDHAFLLSSDAVTNVGLGSRDAVVVQLTHPAAGTAAEPA
jgi:small-conductance mechanosensitive channel